MRKSLAAVLAVLMILSVVAMLPASAVVFDKSTPADVPDIIITEIASDSKSGIKIPSSISGAEYDAFEYMELYNRSDAPIDLYSLALLMSCNYKSDPGSDSAYADVWDSWQAAKVFNAIVKLHGGKLVPEGDMTQELAEQFDTAGIDPENPATALLAPHSNAVVVFVGTSTIKAMGIHAGAIANNDTQLITNYFRELHNVPVEVPVILAWSYNEVSEEGKITGDGFRLADCRNTKASFVYAIADNTFELSEKAYTDTDGFNPKIKSMARFGAQQKLHTGGVSTFGAGALYVTADSKPEYFNAKQKIVNKNFVDKTDYNDAMLVTSYREAALFNPAETAKPGVMPAYQWALLDPENAPADVKGEDPEWAAKAVKAFLDFKFPSTEDDNNDYKDEDKIEVNPPTREELMDKFYGDKDKDKNKNKKDGLPIGAIIGIVVGAVVVVAGAAVAIVLVIKKKNAAAAAAAADAAAMEDVPAEDTPAEDAPVEETDKKDE